MSFEVVCCLALGDYTVYNLLMPISMNPCVTKIWIVRAKKNEHADIPKAEYIIVPHRFKPWRFFRMFIECLKLAKRKEVKAFVSFNPIPYGLISYFAAKRHKKQIHFGFIGTDWYYYTKGFRGKFLTPILKKANFYTVTGKQMKNEMAASDFNPDKISILPHCIDLDRFAVCGYAPKKYACIFIGSLIDIKQVHIIIQSFAKVLKTHPNERLCIIGKGKLSGKLKALAEELNIADKVDFLGFVDDIRKYLADSKIIIIASKQEGFPFVLVEGMCSGLVPVSTAVGTIPDFIVNGENGLLIPTGDPDALASAVKRLLDEPQLYNNIRNNALKMRGHFDYKSAAKIWNVWLNPTDTTSVE